MIIFFSKDATIQSTGFKATFTLERSICGPRIIHLNSINKPQYTLTWPSSAGKYLPNQRCSWEFSAVENNQLALSIERLDTQPNSAQEPIGCSHDYLEIVDSAVNPYIVEGLGSEIVFTGVKSAQIQPTFYVVSYLFDFNYYFRMSFCLSLLESTLC